MTFEPGFDVPTHMDSGWRKDHFFEDSRRQGRALLEDEWEEAPEKMRNLFLRRGRMLVPYVPRSSDGKTIVLSETEDMEKWDISIMSMEGEHSTNTIDPNGIYCNSSAGISRRALDSVCV